MAPRRAPIGAVPALFAAGLLGLAMRAGGRTRAQDTRERMLVPLLGAVLLLGAWAAGTVRSTELVTVVAVDVLALAALVEILCVDRARRAWLTAIFDGTSRAFEIQAAADPFSEGLPPFLAAVTPGAVVVRVEAERGYRLAARSPGVAVGETLEESVRPLLRRLRLVLGLVAVALATTALALAAR